MKSKSNSQGNNFQYKFLILLSTVYLAVYANMQGFLSLMPFIRQEFIISRAQAGLYFTFYSLTATLTAVFTGQIIDKIGPKKGLVFGTISVGIMMSLHSIAPRFFILLIFALITGLVFSIITPAINKAVINKTIKKNRATSMGIMQAGGGIGGFLGASILPLLGSFIGWRFSLLISGTFAILVGFFILRFFSEDDGKDDISASKKKQILKNLCRY